MAIGHLEPTTSADEPSTGFLALLKLVIPSWSANPYQGAISGALDEVNLVVIPL